MSALNDCYYVEHVVRGRWSSAERDRVMLETAREDFRLHPHQVDIWVEQEPGSSGKDAASDIRKKMLAYGVQTEAATGNKETRARPLASACEAGLVRLCRDAEKKYRHWDIDAFLDEFNGFPNGKHDDQVDAASGAFNKLAISAPPSDAVAMGEAELAELEAYL
jgi:predicted phage terminase large subunit-like protein